MQSFLNQILIVVDSTLTDLMKVQENEVLERIGDSWKGSEGKWKWGYNVPTSENHSWERKKSYCWAESTLRKLCTVDIVSECFGNHKEDGYGVLEEMKKLGIVFWLEQVKIVGSAVWKAK